MRTNTLAPLVIGLFLLLVADARTANEAVLENVAHRGLTLEAGLPQNTVEAIAAAYAAGARTVETDFVLTKTGEIICLHDQKALATMSTIVKPPAEITPEDRARIDLGEKMRLKRPYRIPLLEDVLKVVPKDRIIQAEIKVYGATYADKFDAAVKAAGLSETNVTVSAFSVWALRDFKRHCPKYRTMWLGGGVMNKGFDLEAIVAQAKEARISIVCPGCASAIRAGFSRADADFIRKAGFDFRLYGVNSREGLKYAAQVGASGFTCNYFKGAYQWAKDLGDIRLEPVQHHAKEGE